MADDSFIREVNEEIRQDQARALWDRYGSVIIALAVVIVIGTGAYVAWDHWSTNRANEAGDRFASALTLANSGQTDQALEALGAIERDGYGSYPLLARMRSATVLFDKGDAQGAVAGFDAVSTDSGAPQSIRDLARLRAALVLVDHGSYADVAGRAEALTADTNPLRHAAREALGLAAWKEGRSADAMALFEQIRNDNSAPANARQRATLMVELLRGATPAS